MRFLGVVLCHGICKSMLFRIAKQHLSLPQLVPKEFELLEAAELESECSRRTASRSFRWTELDGDRLEPQQAENSHCYAVRPGEPHHLGPAWKPPDRRHPAGSGTPQGGAPCGLRCKEHSEHSTLGSSSVARILNSGLTLMISTVLPSGPESVGDS